MIHVFLTSALLGGEVPASRSGRFTSGERAPVTHWIGDSMGPRTGLGDVEGREILPLLGFEHRLRSQPLYRLRYPDSKLGHSRFVSMLFPIHHSLITQSIDAV
jgi:hypothetical protein